MRGISALGAAARKPVLGVRLPGVGVNPPALEVYVPCPARVLLQHWDEVVWT